jgi:hypothetical protein
VPLHSASIGKHLHALVQSCTCTMHAVQPGGRPVCAVRTCFCGAVPAVLALSVAMVVAAMCHTPMAGSWLSAVLDANKCTAVCTSLWLPSRWWHTCCKSKVQAPACSGRHALPGSHVLGVGGPQSSREFGVCSFCVVVVVMVVVVVVACRCVLNSTLPS